MKTLWKLEKLLLAGRITEEEYKKRKDFYIETLLDMYCMDIITKEQLYDRINK